MKEELRTRLRSSRGVLALNKARHDGELRAVYTTGVVSVYLHSDATSMGTERTGPSGRVISKAFA